MDSNAELYKKIELIITRRAKAYIAVPVHAKLINIQIQNSLSRSHNDSNEAPPCEWYRLVSQPEIAKDIHKNPYFGVQGHSKSLKSAPNENQCTTSY